MNQVVSGLLKNGASNITGNVPKAILCVRKMEDNAGKTAGSAESIKDTAKKAAALQKELLNRISGKLELPEDEKLAKSVKKNPYKQYGYLALEVQYNPSSIYMDTQAGKQVQYSAGNLGSDTSNQLVQIHQPTSTTMSFQLVFDSVNVQDAFMMEGMNLTAGNLISGGANLVKKAMGNEYSVQAQMDGIMALLTQDETRQVIFYWANMCFRGELTSVNSKYTMFNKAGNPIRGVMEISIRQGDEAAYSYDNEIWDKAFDKAFGSATLDVTKNSKNMFSKVTNNNLLNLNL